MEIHDLMGTELIRFWLLMELELKKDLNVNLLLLNLGGISGGSLLLYLVL